MCKRAAVTEKFKVRTAYICSLCYINFMVELFAYLYLFLHWSILVFHEEMSLLETTKPATG